MIASAVRVMPLWPPVSHAGRLGADEIHVWCAALGDFCAELPRLQATLSPDEQARAGRFRSPDDRHVFVVCRGILRQLLAQYLGRDAASIDFSYGRFGKPEVTGFQSHCPVYFNASRSGALVVYAVTSACPVGVDVERLRPIPEFKYIARRFFSPFDADRLLALPPDRQMQEFLACWTCNEALVKATGDGMGRGSRSVQVGTPAHRCARGDTRLPGSWQFQSLRPAAGYVGALVHKADGAGLLRLRVSDRLLNRNEESRGYTEVHISQ